MQKIILDSSVIIGAYIQDDSLHEEAIRFFDTIENYERIYIPYGVIQEVTTHFTYRQGKSFADIFLRDMIETPNIIFLDDSIHEALGFFLESDKKMSFTDISLIRLSLLHQAELKTFDQQLHKLFIRSFSC